LGQHRTGRIEDANPVNRGFARMSRCQLILHDMRAVRFLQFGACGENFVSQDGVVLFEGVPNDN
jgi:hypothetical protein